MAEIVALSTSLLKDLGFRKRRHSFNRHTDAGLIHVVKFWQAPKEPSAWTEVPGLRVRLFGTFRLDFGVFVPEITRMGTPTSDWINDYNCHLRTTIGELMHEPGDFWMPLANPESDRWALDCIQGFGLPWLDQFPDHQHILDAFNSGGFDRIGMYPAAPLDIAEMLAALGRSAEARTMLETYASRPDHGPHAHYLVDYLTRIGHADLVARVIPSSLERRDS